MKVTLRLKHILIPAIVLVITLVGLTYSYINVVAKETLEIGLLFNGPGINHLS